MKRGEKIYEGKAKIMYTTEDPNLLIQYFKDEATAFDGKKKGIILNKGVLNNKISSKIFKFLEEKGIKTHWVKKLSEREMLVKRLKIFPVEVVLRNLAAGSLAKRMGVEEGTPLKQLVMEFYYKNDALGDPMINEDHIQTFDLASLEDMAFIKKQALKINTLLVPFFEERGIKLVDYKLEFGKDREGILLGDEITPDGCRLWDKESNEKLDKDRFRRDLGRVEEAYQLVYQRICGKEG